MTKYPVSTAPAFQDRDRALGKKSSKEKDFVASQWSAGGSNEPTTPISQSRTANERASHMIIGEYINKQLGHEKNHLDEPKRKRSQPIKLKQKNDIKVRKDSQIEIADQSSQS